MAIARLSSLQFWVVDLTQAGNDGAVKYSGVGVLAMVGGQDTKQGRFGPQ